ncbi:MAG: hypothetical protein QOI78_8238 [Actinomycetota bacterium]|nr:hypothetical protein [Actinomycetota bacterium]
MLRVFPGRKWPHDNKMMTMGNSAYPSKNYAM